MNRRRSTRWLVVWSVGLLVVAVLTFQNVSTAVILQVSSSSPTTTTTTTTLLFEKDNEAYYFHHHHHHHANTTITTNNNNNTSSATNINTNNNHHHQPKETHTKEDVSPKNYNNNDDNDNPPHPKQPPKNNIIIYSHARADRSGAAIQDMLMCHAYAFHNHFIYGGACTRDWNVPPFQGKREAREQLLQAVGLSKVLPLLLVEDCRPKDGKKKEEDGKDDDDSSSFKQQLLMNDRQEYIAQDTQIFTQDYIRYLQNISLTTTTTTTTTEYDYSNHHPPPPPPPPVVGAAAAAASASADDVAVAVHTIAVHIRRGDITPCRPRTRGFPRYLPNEHYLKLIDRYNNNNNSRVVIFSESENAFESFDEFTQKGYQVVLDGDISEVWKGIISANVVILSRSSFSLVPAVLTRGKVVYTPFWHQPLPHWDVVDEEFVNATLVTFKKLKQTCPKKKKGKKK